MGKIFFNCTYCYSRIEYLKEYNGLVMLPCPHCSKNNDLRTAIPLSAQIHDIFVSFGVEILKDPIRFYFLFADIVVGYEEEKEIFCILSHTTLFPEIYDLKDSDDLENESKALANRIFKKFYLDKDLVLKVIGLIIKAIYMDDDSAEPKLIVVTNILHKKEGKKLVYSYKKAPYHQGKELYRQKRYEQAYNWFTIGSERGDEECNYYLGFLYLNGKGISKNELLAFNNFLTAASKGYVKAFRMVGNCYEYGTGVGIDISKAIEWYQKGADKGDSDSMYLLGYLYLAGKKVPKDVDLAIKYIIASADLGNADALFILALCYNEGIGVEKSRDLAIKTMMKAAKRGHIKAIKKLQDLGYL